jgi:hypothetical protein
LALKPLASYALGAVAASALLAGCTAGNSPSIDSAVPAAPAQASHELRFDAKTFAMTNRAHAVPERHLNHHKSWMLPDAGKKWLLYVSDGSAGLVDVYDYRTKAGKLFGQITGFSAPYGQCIDGKDNVYITDLGSAMVYEFAHGGMERRRITPTRISR